MVRTNGSWNNICRSVDCSWLILLWIVCHDYKTVKKTIMSFQPRHFHDLDTNSPKKTVSSFYVAGHNLDSFPIRSHFDFWREKMHLNWAIAFFSSILDVIQNVILKLHNCLVKIIGVIIGFLISLLLLGWGKSKSSGYGKQLFPVLPKYRTVWFL